MKIPGFVFLIIGVLVLGVSLFKKQLTFFTYVGGLFILYGVFKMVFKWITNSSPSEIKNEELRRYGVNGQIPTAQTPNFHNAKTQNTQTLNPHNIHASNVQRTQAYKCRRCGNMVFLHNNFCSICGLRLK